MAGKKRGEGSLRAKVLVAIQNVGLFTDDEERLNRNIGVVRSVYDQKPEIQERYKSGVPILALENIAILKIRFDFSSEDVTKLILGDQGEADRILVRHGEEIGLFSKTYSQAYADYPHLTAALASKESFENINLHASVGERSGNQWRENAAPFISLSIARELERVRRSKAFQEGAPDAICLAAEYYTTLGAYEIAESHIHDVLSSNPDHAGGWFQRTRLLLRKSTTAMREATRLHLMSKEGGALSAAETSFEDLAFEELAASRNLRQQAFDACVTAYGLLPTSQEYEKSAVKWSSDYGALRQLRYDILGFIVREAGQRCNPYHGDGELHERIQARLGRTKKLSVAPGSGATCQAMVPDPERMEQLSAQALFTVDADEVILAAYEELKTCPGAFVHDPTRLHLFALNFLRLLAPGETYRREVAAFVEKLNYEYAPHASEYFGSFGAGVDLGEWRTVLHEHLDAIMSQNEQRDLVRKIYARWEASVAQRRNEALLSVYNQEVQSLFAAGDILGAYAAACRAEEEGVYRRDDGWGALVLLRLAQHTARSTQGARDECILVTRHLEDEALTRVAEEYYDTTLAQEEDIHDAIFPLHLWALDAE